MISGTRADITATRRSTRKQNVTNTEHTAKSNTGRNERRMRK
nr:MAG TPA: hypothetical protein [Caudoviricetes sp.]